jgi:3-hydroxybutyryl-CoA dehydrogenase
MGASISAYFLQGGWTVHVYTPSALTRGSFVKRVEMHLGRNESAAGMQVHAVLGKMPWPDIDLVIETVKEDLQIKREIFRDVEELSRPDALITTNTSGFLVSDITDDMKTAERVAGLHHFMPAHLVPLVEIVGTRATSAHTLEILRQWMTDLGKIPIVCVKELPGFVANRIQHALMREALYLISEGIASAEDIDKAVRYGFGFRYAAAGPILQKELSGWDTNYHAAAAIYPSLCNDAHPNPIVASLVKNGSLGTKSRKGFWQWNDEQLEIVIGRYTDALGMALDIVLRDRV